MSRSRKYHSGPTTKFGGLLVPPKLGMGNFGKLEIEIGGNGGRGWIDLVKAVWKDEKLDRIEFRRKSKLTGTLENLQNGTKSGFRHIYNSRSTAQLTIRGAIASCLQHSVTRTLLRHIDHIRPSLPWTGQGGMRSELCGVPLAVHGSCCVPGLGQWERRIQIYRGPHRWIGVRGIISAAPGGLSGVWTYTEQYRKKKLQTNVLCGLTQFCGLCLFIFLGGFEFLLISFRSDVLLKHTTLTRSIHARCPGPPI